MVCFSGLRVQLDATINLKFDTKIDNHINSHSKSESVLQGSSESIIGNYIESPVQAQITKFKLTDNSTGKIISFSSQIWLVNIRLI